MSNLPKLRFSGFSGEWEMMPLKLACQMQAGSFVSATEINEKSDKDLHPCYGGNGLRGFTKTYTHTGKYSLIGRQGALCGNITLATGTFHATEHAVVTTPINNTDTDWLFYELTSLNLNQYSTGQAQPGLSVKNLEEIVVKVPQEQEEQQKIANCLSSIDTLITAQTQKLDTLKAHKKGLMQQLFPAIGETVPKLRFPEFHDAGDWEEKPLKYACKMQAGTFVSASDIFPKARDNLNPCYGGNGLRGYTKTYTHTGKHPLIGRQGEHCGNVNFADGRFHATEHAVVTNPLNQIDVLWLFYALINLELNQYATGQAQPGLSVKVLEIVIIKLPEEIKEQQKIASFLSSLDELLTTQTKKIETLKAHKKGLMQQLFPSTNEVE